MKTFLEVRKLVVLMSLLVCSLAKADLQLPDDVIINKDAGCGGYLIVMLRLESGQELPFIVDTGSPITLLDKSLEPKLGKRLGTMIVTTVKAEKQKGGRFAAPKLFLGNALLLTGSNIVTHDFSPQNPGSAMGILGMDCLRHYCIQLDFVAGRMRFLNHDHVKVAELGKAYPLTFKGNYVFIQRAGLVGIDTNLMVDVGCRIDGLVSTNAIGGLRGLLSECVWDGETYTNLTVVAVDHQNSIGLGFLARHLVTLVFQDEECISNKRVSALWPIRVRNNFLYHDFPRDSQKIRQLKAGTL